MSSGQVFAALEALAQLPAREDLLGLRVDDAQRLVEAEREQHLGRRLASTFTTLRGGRRIFFRTTYRPIKFSYKLRAKFNVSI